MRSVTAIAGGPSASSHHPNRRAAEAQQGSTARGLRLEGMNKQAAPSPNHAPRLPPDEVFRAEEISRIRKQAWPAPRLRRGLAGAGRQRPGRVQRSAHSPPRNPVEQHAGGGACRDP